MATFAELKCFNHLLLEKLERLEKDYKRLERNHKFYKKKNLRNYNELHSLKNCVDLSDVVCCNECVGEMWYSYDDTTLVGDVYVCHNCWNDKGYFECDGCMEPYGDDEKYMKFSVKSKYPSNGMGHSEYYDCELCENCWDEERKRRHKVLMMELISQPSS